MGGDNEFKSLYCQIMDRNDWNITRKAMPITAVVKRYVKPGFRPGIEQATFIRILANDPGEVMIWDSASDLVPGLAVICRLEEIRRCVVELVPSRRDVRTLFFMR